MATSRNLLGDIQRHRGNWDEAEKLYQECLEIETELGDRYKNMNIAIRAEFAILKTNPVTCAKPRLLASEFFITPARIAISTRAQLIRHLEQARRLRGNKE